MELGRIALSLWYVTIATMVNTRSHGLTKGLKSNRPVTAMQLMQAMGYTAWGAYTEHCPAPAS